MTTEIPTVYTIVDNGMGPERRPVAGMRLDELGIGWNTRTTADDQVFVIPHEELSPELIAELTDG